MHAVVGRELELGAVGELLDQVTAGGSSVLVLEGAAGIGKTTVWRAGVDQARGRGFTVLSCGPAPTETVLSYAGLSDLLTEVGPGDLDRLPRPQARALNAVLLRAGDGHAPDPRAVAAGLLSMLTALAGTSPLLLAIDDAQWLDAPSRDAVEFAVRRCHGPLGVLVAQRDDAPGARPGDWRPRVADRLRVAVLDPMSQGAMHELLRRRTARPLRRSVLARISALSGGNPFFALELARCAADDARAAIVLPGSLQGALRDRLDRLPPPVYEALRVVAALAAPCVDTVARALETDDARDLLEVAEDEGVIDLTPEGSVRFTHPLLAAGVDARTPPRVRRALHLRLSSIVGDAEERAHHLALAALGPDPETIAALDAAAAQARRRGAPGRAAELLELASRLGATEPSRQVQAAQDHFAAGDPVRARELLDAAIAALSHGALRARALGQLGMARFELGAAAEGARLLEQAIMEAARDIALRCSTRVDLSFVLFVGGRIAEARTQVGLAVEDGERLDDPGLLAEALASSVIIRFLSGEGTDDAALERALALEDRDSRTPVRRWPSTVAAQIYRWTHRLDEARAAFMGLRQRCLENGAESDLWFISLGAVPAACWVGDIEGARWLVGDAIDRAQLSESDNALGMAQLFQTQLAAWVGDVAEARRAGREATALLSPGGASTIALEVPAAVGMAELSDGDLQAAAHHLRGAAEAAVTMGFAEPASAQFLPDAAETLIATGCLEQAEPVVDLLEASGRRPARPWAEAVGARCRGLLLDARRRPDEALSCYERALAAHERVPQLRYDRARTLLVLGAAQRRRSRRRAAHAALTEAAGLFDAVGAALWARRARADVDRLGLCRGDGDALTATEEHIATLAASGLTNREVAAALFVSPKTVETHITRVYRKLEIRSRAELGWRMAERSRSPDGST